MWKTVLMAGAAWLALAAAPAMAQPAWSTTTLPANPGTGGGYAGELAGPGSIGGNPDGVMGNPGTNGAFPNGPAGPSSLTGDALTATGSLNGLTGGYPLSPDGRAVLLGVNPG